jgi:2-polyprenyl-3-methyl-5-hydroxy-6-metoxy-1,4-benzoquinol methylase
LSSIVQKSPTLSISPHGDGKVMMVTTKGKQQRTCISSYPESLVRHFAAIYGIDDLCDQLQRDEKADYILEPLQLTLFSHTEPNAFEGKKILDFGCGTGASTCILGRILPQSTIVGIDFRKDHIELAKERSQIYPEIKVSFQASPDTMTVPFETENFDFIVLNAVYEHLLPAERPLILKQLWTVLKPGGIIFINETPNSYFPIETHTTPGFPFINYLPDSLLFPLLRATKQFKGMDNEALLRAGIRGGSYGEIAGLLKKQNADFSILKPSKNGIYTPIQLAKAALPKNRLPLWIATFLFWSLKILYSITGVVLTPVLHFAIQKK